jgi:hypothetical protein
VQGRTFRRPFPVFYCMDGTMQFTSKIEIHFLNEATCKDLFQVITSHFEKTGGTGRVQVTNPYLNWEKKRVSGADLKRVATLKLYKEILVPDQTEQLNEGYYYIVKVPAGNRKCSECDFKLTEGCYSYAMFSINNNSIPFLCPQCSRGLFADIQQTGLRVTSSKGHQTVVLEGPDFVSKTTPPIRSDFDNALKQLSLIKRDEDTHQVYHFGDPDYRLRRNYVTMAMYATACTNAKCSKCEKNNLGAHVYFNFTMVELRDLDANSENCLECGVETMYKFIDYSEKALLKYDSLVDKNYAALACLECPTAARCITRDFEVVKPKKKR